jgi:predicted nucleic acid-binding protein
LARVVVLDAGPLGLVTNAPSDPDAAACRAWLAGLAAAGVRVLIPEIADYEVRRELIRSGSTEGIRRLDILGATYEFIPITTRAMLLAARLWAEARRIGRPGADPKKLDADVIVTAQAYLATGPGDSLTVATTNARHFAVFLPAERWQDIP